MLENKSIHCAHVKMKCFVCRFLLGDELCRLDCEVLPKLHHVRVASATLKSLNIPSEFSGIWRQVLIK